MKKIALAICCFVFSAIIIFSIKGVLLAKAADGKPSVNSGNQVVAYYFRGNFRCYTCHTIEQYSREAIEANFKDELASGKLEFRAVNVEERGNEHYVNDYQLYTRSLILSLVKDGKEIKSKNLEKIWQYARNKQKFIDYVTNEVNSFLKEAE